MLLQGKVAIVTGGSSGIGESIVVALAQAGAAVCINYRTHPDSAEETRQEIIAKGGQAITVQADVSRVEDLQKLVTETVAAFGRLDVMVNNAGMETRSSILDTTEAQYDRVLAVDLKSAFFGTQLAAKQMNRTARHSSRTSWIICSCK